MNDKTPRKKRLKRPARLESARNWLKTYPGKRIVIGYAKNYGVTKLCAIKELRMLGIEVSEEYENQLRQSLERVRKQKEFKKKQQSMHFTDSDYDFAWIAGYTSGGYPYGITHEELEKNDILDAEIQNYTDDDLPF